MFYYEDFMDGVDAIPKEIVNGLAQMGGIDSQVQESVITTQNNVNTLFSNADNMSQDELDTKFEDIIKEGENAVVLSEEKVNLANQMHGLLSKYMKRLDNELNKFKTDLEVNNSGITDIIEKRVLEEDNIRENKSELSRNLFGETRVKIRTSKKNLSAKRSSASSLDVHIQSDISPTTSQNDLSTLVNSFKQTDIENTLTAQNSFASGAAQLTTPDTDKTIERPGRTRTTSDEDVNETVNPDDARFCICNEVAYGSMVACDNEKKCPYEWYHFECVGITVRPKGVWYCPQCRVKNRNLKRRSKK